MGLLFGDDNSPRKSSLTKSQRDKIIAATGAKCLAKGVEHVVPREALDVQHIKPRKMGGTDRLENLTVLCATHHQLAHAGKVIQQNIAEILSPRKLATLRKDIRGFKPRDTRASDPWRIL